MYFPCPHQIVFDAFRVDSFHEDVLFSVVGCELGKFREDFLAVGVVAAALAVGLEDVFAGLGELQEGFMGGGVLEVPHFCDVRGEEGGVGLAEVFGEDWEGELLLHAFEIYELHCDCRDG